MNFVFLMDPLETVIMENDTSFVLMLGALRRKHHTYFVPDGGITLRDGKVYFHATRVVAQQKARPFKVKETVRLSEDQVHAIFVRSDPPFDQQYLLNTWYLDRLPARIPVINSPHGLRTVNEKIWATQFTSLVPPTLISRSRQEITSFIAAHKNVIAKPTDGHGGVSIFFIRQNDKNTNVILETLTELYTKDIVVQKYIPAAQKGDKRILLLNGEPLGVLLRVHSKSDHRNNLYAGGKPKPATITANDRRIIETLKPYLVRLGLYFVGIDILGNYLIEVNVTSPTCIQEINRLYKKNLELTVIEFVEDLVGRQARSVSSKE